MKWTKKMSSHRKPREIWAQQLSRQFNCRRRLSKMRKISRRTLIMPSRQRYVFLKNFYRKCLKPTIETALHLLTAPQTCQFHSRQLSYLDRLASRTRSCGGVLLSEISSFTKLLTVLEDQLSEVPDYKVAIKQLISLITGALLKQRTSDETNFAKDTIQLLEKVKNDIIFAFFNYF